MNLHNVFLRKPNTDEIADMKAALEKMVLREDGLVLAVLLPKEPEKDEVVECQDLSSGQEGN